MSIILERIKQNFGVDEEFTAWDIHKITKINLETVRENLSILINTEKLTYVIHHELGIYKLRKNEETLLFLRNKKDLMNHT